VPVTAENFDEAAYLGANPDVAAAVAAGKVSSGRQHFERHGHAEQRGQFVEAAPFSFYETRLPSSTNALDLFAGRWTSDIPGHEGYGTLGLFNAPLIAWFLEKSGGVAGRRILELGPLEGGNTRTLSMAGAHVTAIEANAGAYLRCLITKEVLGFDAKFLLGDFASFVAHTTERYDAVVASGVLYHMERPIELLKDLARITKSIMIWTHYFDDEVLRQRGLRERFSEQPVVQMRGDLAIELWEYRYPDEAVQWAGFCGGPARICNWLTRRGLFDLLEQNGFTLTINADTRDHPNGPAIGLLAERAQ
jgi:SAM-dependent methyltransferase